MLTAQYTVDLARPSGQGEGGNMRKGRICCWERRCISCVTSDVVRLGAGRRIGEITGFPAVLSIV